MMGVVSNCSKDETDVVSCVCKSVSEDVVSDVCSVGERSDAISFGCLCLVGITYFAS